MFDFCIYERFWSGWIVFCQGLSEVRVNFYKEGTKAKSQQESLNENRWRNPDVQGGESETDLWCLWRTAKGHFWNYKSLVMISFHFSHLYFWIIDEWLWIEGLLDKKSMLNFSGYTQTWCVPESHGLFFEDDILSLDCLRLNYSTRRLTPQHIS